MSPTYIMYTPYFQFFAIEKDFHVYLLLSLGLFHVTYSFKMHYICISFQGQIKTQSFTSNIFPFLLDTSCIVVAPIWASDDNRVYYFGANLRYFQIKYKKCGYY